MFGLAKRRKRCIYLFAKKNIRRIQSLPFMDWRTTLNVTDTATPQDIKKNFRRLSLEHHPDRGGDPGMFQRIHEAYKASQQAPSLPERQDKGVVDITLEHAFPGGPAAVYTANETTYVNIPPGTDDREILHVDGRAYQVRLSNDTKFVRKGMHLYYTHYITLREALLGFVLVLDNLDGTSLRITKENGEVVQPGQKKTIPNNGIRRGGACGDLIITFEVILPSKLTARQRECLENF